MASQPPHGGGAEYSESQSGRLFGNYSFPLVERKIPDHDLNSLPDLNSQHSRANHRAALIYRDDLVASYLRSQGVGSILDVGSDSGSLIERCNDYGMQSFGIDINPAGNRSAKVNFCRKSIQELVASQSIAEFYKRCSWPAPDQPLAISCLNILHVPWSDNLLKAKLLEFLFESSSLLVITAGAKLLRELRRDFGPFRIYRFGHRNWSHLSERKIRKLYDGPTDVVGKVAGRIANRNSGPVYRFPNKIESYAAMTVAIANGTSVRKTYGAPRVNIGSDPKVR